MMTQEAANGRHHRGDLSAKRRRAGHGTRTAERKRHGALRGKKGATAVPPNYQRIISPRLKRPPHRCGNGNYSYSQATTITVPPAQQEGRPSQPTKKTMETSAAAAMSGVPVVESRWHPYSTRNIQTPS